MENNRKCPHLHRYVINIKSILLISKCILLGHGYDTILCGLQTAKHGGIIWDYLVVVSSFRIVAIGLIFKATGQT
jgi:hypothetical protein